MSRARGIGWLPLVCLVLLAMVAGLPEPAAQSDDPYASADSLSAAADTSGSPYGSPPRSSGGHSAIEEARRRAAADSSVNQSVSVAVPQSFFMGISNAPKAGALANVRQNTFYADLVTTVRFQKNSMLRNTFKWSWEEYRKQDKNVQKRDNLLTYGLGDNLPVVTSIDAAWNWSEDNTVNTAGFANLAKRNMKRAGIHLIKSNFRTGFLNNTAKASANINDQQSINQNQRNNFNEGTLNGGLQSDMRIASGVMIAGRIYGKTTSGDRLLGTTTSPSSANGDSLGFGVYYNQTWANGRAAATSSNFDKKYLDFRRNSNGLIDTVGIDEDDKVVTELETTDAMAYELENNFRFGRVGFNSRLTRVTNDLDHAVSGVGLREREQDVMDLALTFAAGRDSFALSYDYLWKWDDQRYKNATENRGRQFNKSRDYEFNYVRQLFRKTRLNLRYHEGLSQDVAQDQFNDNDKDRHQSDIGARMERTWVNKFRTSLVFAYQQVQDFNIRASRSSNNNVRNSYEVSPGYGWTISRWLSLDQSYRVYIQYTDYSYAGSGGTTRQDDYNKRGNLATKVIIDPTRRLKITLRHDFNKRFAATKSGTDASGNAFYRRDLNQTISKIEMLLKFVIAPNVTLEASTYRTKDDRTTFGTTTNQTLTYSGEMWVGAQVRKKWFQKNPLELSAMVRKFNAFGPSVTETSSDYWEADIWLSWEF